jgi:hypothetical protein
LVAEVDGEVVVRSPSRNTFGSLSLVTEPMSEAAFSPDPVPPPNRKRHWRLAGMLICPLLAVVLFLACFVLFHHPGIHVSVENTGNLPIRSVVLYVKDVNQVTVGNTHISTTDTTAVTSDVRLDKPAQRAARRSEFECSVSSPSERLWNEESLLPFSSCRESADFSHRREGRCYRQQTSKRSMSEPSTASGRDPRLSMSNS